MTGRPSISYLLDGTDLSGGVKVVLHHANLLRARGHEVTVVSNGPRPDWYPVRTAYRQVAWRDGEGLPEADVTVATYWTTLSTVAAVATGQPLHFCQGYEGSFAHTVRDHPAIESAYATAMPAIAVTPHLQELLARRFGRPAVVVTPALERGWRSTFRLGPRRRPRILVPGIFEAELKGVRTALAAIRSLRDGGMACDLVRLSPWPLSEEEARLLPPDEYHAAVPPARVQTLLRSCDLAMVPSSAVEGFGLPLVEAMASGVPVVASDIPSFAFIAKGAARLVPFDDPEAFSTAARELLLSPAAWRAARRSGRRDARRFGEIPVADRLVDAMQWAYSGAWRSAPAKRLQVSAEAGGPG